VNEPLGTGEVVNVYRDGTLLGTATVVANGTTWAYTDTTAYTGGNNSDSTPSAGWTYTAKVADAVGNLGSSTDRHVTFNAVTTGSAGANITVDATANAITYTAGDTVHALGGNDTITVTATTLQADLVSAGFIDGGAGIDTLKLAAGTTLNLETLTTNQTVQQIQEVEILQMQGTSTLIMSANDVLSLGGANATTMSPYFFTETQQLADGSVNPTGSTGSAGKVQMVIQGLSTDTLKLDALANDGMSHAGVFGNTGLTGNWSYMGQAQIGLNTFKVYNHSTTNAQVLVDVPVVVNTISPIKIVSIVDSTTSSSDTGLSAGDFTTKDNTLTYSGTVPVELDPSAQDVFVEILNSGGNVVQSGVATVTGTNWQFDNTSATLADGTYSIRSTIVDKNTTTATAAFGSMGQDIHPLTIDTAAPTIAVTRTGTGTLAVGQTDTITFTLSENATDFVAGDVTVTGGTLSNFSGSGKVYTATFTPNSGSGTATIFVDSNKFSDVAGNFNADGAEANNTASVPYITLPPQQIVTFGSMTKDSGRSTGNDDWFTADASAGRLVSGSISAPLATGEVVKVYANGTLIGEAEVNGQQWEITDLNGYNAGWTYTAQVVDSAGNTGALKTQVVNGDFTEPAPVITGVTDSGSTAIGHNGTTTKTLSSVSGTGNAGDTIYLYDN
ncbi:MAG: Ig-like domain-containing protein, partial [Limnohabitans sp.]|nr:Ig-like domain-containing protein [Limnohabitans sp.]